MNARIASMVSTAAGTALCLLSGCAYAKLDVQVDVYDGDPHVEVAQDPKELLRIQMMIEARQRASTQAAKARIQVGEALVEFLIAYYPGDRSELETDLPRDLEIDAYVDTLNGLAMATDRAAERAGEALDAFATLAERVKRGDDVPVTRLIEARRLLGIRLSALDAAYKKPTEKLEGVHFAEVVETLSMPADSDRPDGDTVFEQMIGDLTALEGIARQEGESATLALVEALREAEASGLRVSELGATTDAVLDIESVTPANLRNQVRQVVALASRTASGPGFSQEGELAIRQLGHSFQFLERQIDRLQDPADPAWRIVTDPANSHRWLPCFSHAHTRSEGNTSTVLVRDRVGRFRVQRANNNPSALIQGQARITRSLASNALQILKAATGVTLPEAESSPSGDTGGAAAANDSGEMPDLAAVEESYRSGQLTRRLLLEELSAARLRMQNAADGAVNDEAGRLKGLLERYAEILNPEEGGDG